MPKRHFQTTSALIATLIVSTAGCDDSKAPATNSGTPSAPGLQIKPLPSMSDILDVPMEKDHLVIYRCDFVATNVRDVQLKLVAVRNGEVLELGEVRVLTLGN